MKILEESTDIQQLNEIFFHVLPSLPTNIENSIYYAKIKTLLHPEIVIFCKEKTELKQDLTFFRMTVGEKMTEKAIREYLDALKNKYNTVDNNIGIEYHLEITRTDIGVPVFVAIKRDDFYIKKFVFRFRKGLSSSLGDLSNAGILMLKEETERLKQRQNDLAKFKKLEENK